MWSCFPLKLVRLPLVEHGTGLRLVLSFCRCIKSKDLARKICIDFPNHLDSKSQRYQKINKRECRFPIFWINSSTALRSSLINSQTFAPKWFLCLNRENLFYSKLKSPSIFFWTNKLGKSLHYIRFIRCVVYTNDGGLPQTMFESRRRKLFPSPPLGFRFSIKLIREEKKAR